MAEPYTSILVERETDGVTFVILNRPEKRNAMSPELHREMCEALDELEIEDATKIVVVRGRANPSLPGKTSSFISAAPRTIPRPAPRRGMIPTIGGGRNCRSSRSRPSRW